MGLEWQGYGATKVNKVTAINCSRAGDCPAMALSRKNTSTNKVTSIKSQKQFWQGQK
jgi:hypothetical protein